MLSTEVIGKRKTLYYVEVVDIVSLGRYQYVQVLYADSTTFLGYYATCEEQGSLLRHMDAAATDEVVICVVPIVE